MLFEISGIPIYFPYDVVYPEQLTYIRGVIANITGSGHVLIEMPSGTGKTISLLSSTISYQLYCKKQGIPIKIIYCSRTIQEIDKALKELKHLVFYIKSYGEFAFLGLGLSSRFNMCINEEALRTRDVDLACRRMVNRLKGLKCDFFENTLTSLPSGVYTFEDIKSFSTELSVCPYFIARESLLNADCIIHSDLPYRSSNPPNYIQRHPKKYDCNFR